MNATKRSFYWGVLLPGALIPLIVGGLFAWPQALPLGSWVYYLPAGHAIVNGSTALLLLGALWAIQKNHLRLHKYLMYLCVGLGALFLLSYVLYHGSVPSTRYGDSNADGLLSTAEIAAVGHWRSVYLGLLISHILLSVFVVFLVLMALHYARLHQFKSHKSIVRYAFPLWWYVSASGVGIYFMIRPFYP